jgi:subtilisin family serine protease
MTEVGIHCAVFFVPDGQSVEKIIAILSQDQRVQIVQKMHQFKTRSHHYNDPYYKLQSNMHNMQIDLAHKIATGKNVTIAMIDSGVDIEHPDLKGQIEFNGDYTPSSSSSFSNDIHGTAIAGVMVAHSDNKKGIVGIAPNAKLIVLKACWPASTHSHTATCNSFTLALAVNTAIKLGAKILNMSLAGPHDPLLEILLNKAIKNGMIVIAADSTNKKDKNRFPASLKNVISVQTLKYPSSRNKNNHSIIAPGENVLTTIPFATYDFISGSSIAAAQVSGIVALLLELKPDLTLSKAKKILFNSILNSYSENNKVSSYAINANAAVMQMCKKKICPEHI